MDIENMSNLFYILNVSFSNEELKSTSTGSNWNRLKFGSLIWSMLQM